MTSSGEAKHVRLGDMSTERVQGEHLIHGDTEESIMSRFAVFRETGPEEDESWESWYHAALDMLQDEVRQIFALSNNEGNTDV